MLPPGVAVTESPRAPMRIDRWLVAAWTLVVAGGVLLFARADALPEEIPVYRSLTGEALKSAPRSTLIVLRIALMGVGQLGAITAMMWQSRANSREQWTTFWQFAALAAGAKTLLECVQFSLLGVEGSEAMQLPLTILTFAPVVAFLLYAVRVWRSLPMDRFGPLSATEQVLLASSLALWFGCAIMPLWLG